jgi:hypothetical protein
VGNVIIEKALLIIRIVRTPRDKVSNPVFGAIIIAHQKNNNILSQKGKENFFLIKYSGLPKKFPDLREHLNLGGRYDLFVRQ